MTLLRHPGVQRNGTADGLVGREQEGRPVTDPDEVRWCTVLAR
jgi:hypothetical protein